MIPSNNDPSQSNFGEVGKELTAIIFGLDGIYMSFARARQRLSYPRCRKWNCQSHLTGKPAALYQSHSTQRDPTSSFVYRFSFTIPFGKGDGNSTD